MDIAAEVAIVSAIITGTTFVIKKIVCNVKHETLQCTNILELQNSHRTMDRRINKLESSDKDRELSIISIKEKMDSLVNSHETTQTMISNLTEMQQKTFSELITTIHDLSKPN